MTKYLEDPGYLPQPKDWERITRIGLLPGISSPDKYADLISEGGKWAKRYLLVVTDPVPSLDLVKKTHFLTFGKVHPWAGSFRAIGEEVMVGNLVCSRAKDVVPDLRSLEKEMRTSSLVGSRSYLSETIAFYHASFLAIHPFLDGNGRTSRLILEHQSRLLLGHSFDLSTVDRRHYNDALLRAQQQGDLSKLSDIVLGKRVDKVIEVPAQGREQDTPQLSPTAKLLKREKELLEQRRKLGFVGSDLESHYGLGGYPKPLTTKEALARAQALLRNGKRFKKSPSEVAAALMRLDKERIKQREEVSKELSRVRSKLIDKLLARELLETGISKKR